MLCYCLLNNINLRCICCMDMAFCWPCSRKKKYAHLNFTPKLNYYSWNGRPFRKRNKSFQTNTIRRHPPHLQILFFHHPFCVLHDGSFCLFATCQNIPASTPDYDCWRSLCCSGMIYNFICFYWFYSGSFRLLSSPIFRMWSKLIPSLREQFWWFFYLQ